jgi:hypothetical protein
MDRGSNLNIADFWKGAHSYYAVTIINYAVRHKRKSSRTQKYNSDFNGFCNGRDIFVFYFNFL